MSEYHYIVDGRVIPERTYISISATKLTLHIQNASVDILFRIVLSKINIHYDSPIPIPFNELRSMSNRISASILDSYSFQKHQYLDFIMDSAYGVKEKTFDTFAIGGFAFSDKDLIMDAATFQPVQSDADMPLLPIDIINDRQFQLAASELRKAIKYHDETAHHCKLAIEAVMRAFELNSESSSWTRMRTVLQLRKTTLQTINSAAGNMRHGRIVPQTWEERRTALQIAWEVVHRYVEWLRSHQPDTLEFPKF